MNLKEKLISKGYILYDFIDLVFLNSEMRDEELIIDFRRLGMTMVVEGGWWTCLLNTI